MEVLIDCYFDRLFDGMDRSSLASRHKRRQLVKFFSDVIKSCAEAENLEKADVCERIVRAALRYHSISMAENGSVCMLGKFHNVLYVAAKLCYDWQINNNELVAKILDDMFYCEKTFERIFVGAIFGTRVTHFLSGWKSDFDDREENMLALVYFLDHAVAGRLEYDCQRLSSRRRFIDVPMESYGQVLPLRVAVQNGSPDILQIMLRYGASTENDKLAPAPIEILLSRLNEYDEDVNCPQHLLTCLKLLLRTIPSVYIKVPSHVAETCGIQRVSVYEQYPNLTDKNLLPPERSGIRPPELRHLCRCRIRQCLFENWALPHGIRQLQIPKTLQDYLDLLAD
ncbi:uncharacterized protein LOC100678008 [Nasonia vitripennis]|uniref:SOCS box domain-containing protein n=1 Tax=Nasonia vitripennis TaxID=7425 RepID=A0A7M7LNR0_NASVI|nr:uncharacterized protein LOC100678008 [Nasonia vitripennis]